MTFDDPKFDDTELDEILRVTRARFIARTDADFDFEVGLDDVQERAGLPFARVPARPRGSGPGALSAGAALACADIEEFVLVLSSDLISSGPLPDLVGSHLQRAADVLLGLRQQLTAGTASEAGAKAAIASVRDTLIQADLILRVEVGASLDGADTDAWLRRIAEHVTSAGPAQESQPAQESLREARRRQASNRRRKEGGQSRGR
jgi:hypothetical protein